MSFRENERVELKKSTSELKKKRTYGKVWGKSGKKPGKKIKLG
jgi:hypothetical protein